MRSADDFRLRRKSGRIAADVRRFGHVINKDGVLGTHSRAFATCPRFVCHLLQRGAYPPGASERCTITPSSSALRADRCHAYLVRTAPPIYADVIFGKDRRRIIGLGREFDAPPWSALEQMSPLSRRRLLRALSTASPRRSRIFSSGLSDPEKALRVRSQPSGHQAGATSSLPRKSLPSG